MQLPFLTVISALNSSKVQYVIVGGFAAVMRGSNRFTSDLDIVVDFSKEEISKLVKAFDLIGFKSRLPVDPMLLADTATRETWINEKNMQVFTFLNPNSPLFLVDVFVKHPIAFADLYSESEVIHFDKSTARICSLKHLIELKKLAARPQDLLDIEALESIYDKNSK